VRPGTLPTANYSLKINRPISKAELVTALETILELNGVSVSPMGERFLKVTALSQAKSEAPEMITGSSLDLPASGKIVTQDLRAHVPADLGVRAPDPVLHDPGDRRRPRAPREGQRGHGHRLAREHPEDRAAPEDGRPAEAGHPHAQVLRPEERGQGGRRRLEDQVDADRARGEPAALHDLLHRGRPHEPDHPDRRPEGVPALRHPDRAARHQVGPLHPHGGDPAQARRREGRVDAPVAALISGQNAATQKSATQSVRPGQIAGSPETPAPPPSRPRPRRSAPRPPARANSAASSRSSPTSGRTRSSSRGPSTTSASSRASSRRSTSSWPRSRSRS
jgi:hypothetical protein